MRILLDKDTFNKFVKKHNDGTIQQMSHFKKSQYYCLLLSKSCILRRINRRLEKVVFNDGEQRLVKSNKYELIGDDSSVSYVPINGFQLPTQIIEIPIIHTIYKLQKTSTISLHYEQLNVGIIRDIWFEIDDEFIDNKFVMEDIDTFLCC